MGKESKMLYLFISKIKKPQKSILGNARIYILNEKIYR